MKMDSQTRQMIFGSQAVDGISFKITQMMGNGCRCLQRSPLSGLQLSPFACTTCPLKKGSLPGEGGLQSVYLGSEGSGDSDTLH